MECHTPQTVVNVYPLSRVNTPPRVKAAVAVCQSRDVWLSIGHGHGSRDPSRAHVCRCLMHNARLAKKDDITYSIGTLDRCWLGLASRVIIRTLLEPTKENMSGYPPPAGFNTNFDSNYPPQGGHGYPPQGQMGYPPQGGPIGYPPQTGGPMGYPPQTGGPMGYPPQAGGPMGAPGQPPFSGPGVPPSAYPQPGYGGPPPTGPPAPGYGSFGYGAPTMGGAMGPGYGGPQPPPPPPAGPGYGAPAGYGGMGAAGPAYGTPPASSGYYSGRPTVVPAPNFDPGKDADELRKAMRGL
ncbi:unnamed protein product, partial [Mesocestoides corti]